ncbi:aspartate dehydrogenase domain-containing protein [Saccharopolyspora sp. NPDC000359]|uniref:aspartate dehydrogenase domain-containing protein n=1 Tax=Saccharopolyspora sp. NPDC000359 TaxID=3154251 RepID=UPI0033275F7E
MKVVILGCGAIGGVVARAVRDGEVPGAELVGVVHAGPTDPPDLPVLDFEVAAEQADLVVECAGQRALAELGPPVVASGADLLVVSVGALADEALLAKLRDTGPGALHLCSGAVGGLDVLTAAARSGGLSSVRIATTKKAPTLVQGWMDAEQQERIRTTTEPVELMRGPARAVTAAFPASANVAASVALAVGDWDLVEATVVADPNAPLTSHVITAEGASGDYRFEIGNHPSPGNPATSGVVPHAVLAAVARLARPTGAFA